MESDGWAAMDAAILQTAFEVREQDGGRPTVFVTMDTNLRIRADALGMVAETYENQRVETQDLDTGIVELEVSADEIDAFFQEGHFAPAAHLIQPERGEKVERASTASLSASKIVSQSAMPSGPP